MNVRQVMEEANNLADEAIEEEILIGFINDCTAQINSRAKANFPFYSITDLETEFVIPEKWVRVLYIPFVAARIKQQDSSQFEYMDLYAQFERGLGDFISYYVIPDDYVDNSSDGYIDPETGEWVSYTSDIYKKPPFPWARW